MKKVIFALVLGMFLGSVSNTFAAVGDKVEAVFASFNYKINGLEKSTETQPLVINGTSYLPVREIANMLGYDVTYKSDSSTIEFSTTATGGINKMASTEKLSEVQKNLDVIKQTLEQQKKDKEQYQNLLTQSIQKLQSNKLNQDDIDKNDGVKDLRLAIQQIEEQIPKTEQYITELQNQINELQPAQ